MRRSEKRERVCVCVCVRRWLRCVVATVIGTVASSPPPPAAAAAGSFISVTHTWQVLIQHPEHVQSHRHADSHITVVSNIVILN